jgi:hypothetical protein
VEAVAPVTPYARPRTARTAGWPIGRATLRPLVLIARIESPGTAGDATRPRHGFIKLNKSY